MSTELPVRDPWFVFLVGFEREGVDEYGCAVYKLDIESVRVFKNHAVSECYFLNLQRC